MSGAPCPGTGEVLMTDLQIGDQFTFDRQVYTVVEPPQSVWGVVELWVAELDWPLQGSDRSTVHRWTRGSDGPLGSPQAD